MANSPTVTIVLVVNSRYKSRSRLFFSCQRTLFKRINLQCKSLNLSKKCAKINWWGLFLSFAASGRWSLRTVLALLNAALRLSSHYFSRDYQQRAQGLTLPLPNIIFTTTTIIILCANYFIVINRQSTTRNISFYFHFISFSEHLQTIQIHGPKRIKCKIL